MCPKSPQILSYRDIVLYHVSVSWRVKIKHTTPSPHSLSLSLSLPCLHVSLSSLLLLIGISCGKPSLTDYLELVESNSYRYGDHIQFKCPVGFRLIGNQFGECLHNATWSVTVPDCQPISCGYLELQRPFLALFVNTSFMGQAYLGCEQGFAIVNEFLALRCLANGSWLVPKTIYCKGKISQKYLGNFNTRLDRWASSDARLWI